MPKRKIQVMQISSGDRTISDRTALVDGLAIVDDKNKICLLARDPITYNATSSSRFLPWTSSRPFVAWSIGDAEPLALHLPEYDYRTETARVTYTDRIELNNERAALALVDAAGSANTDSPLRLFARVVSGGACLVGFLSLISYYNNGSMF